MGALVFSGTQSHCFYPSDVEEERLLVVSYLTLLPEATAQREHSPREVGE